MYRIDELNSKSLYELCSNKFTLNRKESYSRGQTSYHKFRISKGNSIVVFFSRAGKWKWFYQNDSRFQFDIFDGIKKELWTEKEVLSIRTCSTKESVEIEEPKEIEYTDLIEYSKSIVKIDKYNYVKRGQKKDFWFSLKLMYKNKKGALVLPQYLLVDNKFENVGFAEKSSYGFKRYVGGRGLVLGSVGARKSNVLILGENILDCIAYCRMENIESANLIATHGNISQEMLKSIERFMEIFKIEELITVFDNDNAGETYRDIIARELGNMEHIYFPVPTLKDWFEDYTNEKI